MYKSENNYIWRLKEKNIEVTKIYKETEGYDFVNKKEENYFILTEFYIEYINTKEESLINVKDNSFSIDFEKEHQKVTEKNLNEI
ncbi:MAG TPA: hypothetical protein VNW99_02010 [Cytophagaceae bacterium]|jgi:hypothetical protein|nr:hypothetical protein [Cytophagaceae bacterium]